MWYSQPAADIGIFCSRFNERWHICWGRITHAGPCQDQPETRCLTTPADLPADLLEITLVFESARLLAATSTLIWGEVLPGKPRSTSRFHRFPETRLPWLTGQLPLLRLRPQTWKPAAPSGSKGLRYSVILRAGGPITVTPLPACSWRKHAAGSTYTLLPSSGGWGKKREMCF